MNRTSPGSDLPPRSDTVFWERYRVYTSYQGFGHHGSLLPHRVTDWWFRTLHQVDRGSQYYPLKHAPGHRCKS